MRRPAPTLTDNPLPLATAPAADAGSPPDEARPGDPVLAGDAVARFNDLLHELHPDAPHLDQPRLVALAHWLQALPPAEAEAVLQARLSHVDELRALLADPDWDIDPALRARLDKLLRYLAADDDLIPDRLPLLGLLDDAVLLELAWPAFADEAEDYRDFCAYRDAMHPLGEAAQRRAAWIGERLAEGALWQQLHRVRDSTYAMHAPITTGFRVG